ncbi:MAG: cell division protein ZapA [Terriglobia bacterium]
MSKDIRLEIFGELHSIRSELHPAYVEQLARLVDAKMRALAEQTDTLDTRRLAVLAALNLADELQQLKEELEAEGGAGPREVARRLEQCNRLLEAALGSPPAR